MLDDVDVWVLFKKVIYKSNKVRYQDKEDMISELFLRYKRRKLEFRCEQQVVAYAYKSILSLLSMIYRNYYSGYSGLDMENIINGMTTLNMKTFLIRFLTDEEIEIVESFVVDKFSVKEMGMNVYRKFIKIREKLEKRLDEILYQMRCEEGLI